MKLPFGLGKNSPDSEPGRVDPNVDPNQAAGAENETTRMPAAGSSSASAPAQGKSPAQASNSAPNPGERAAPQAVGAPKSKSRWPLGKDSERQAATGAGAASSAPAAGASGKDGGAPIAEKPISLDGDSASAPLAPETSSTTSTSTQKSAAAGAGGAAAGGAAASATAATGASGSQASDDSATAAIPVEEMPQAPRTESTSVPKQASPDAQTQEFAPKSSAQAPKDGEESSSGGTAGKAAAAGAAGAGGLGLGALIGSKSKDSGERADPDARTRAFAQSQNANETQTQSVGATGEGHSGMTTDNSHNQTTAFPTAGYNYADFDENTQGYDYDGADGQVAPVAATEPAAKPVRGTADFGLFVLRVVVAALLGLHSLRIVFGLFGGPGFDGMTEVFSSAGFDQAQALSYGFGIAGLVAAVILLLGIVTPIGATVLLALVGLSAALTLASTGGATILGGSDLSGAPGGGLELHILYAAALLTILFAGGGRWGLDAGRKWAAAPKWSGFLGIIVAVAAVIVVWYLLNGSNPLSS